MLLKTIHDAQRRE